MPRHAVVFTGYADTSGITHANTSYNVNHKRRYVTNHTECLLSRSQGTAIRHKSHTQCLSQITHRLSHLQGTATRHN